MSAFRGEIHRQFVHATTPPVRVFVAILPVQETVLGQGDLRAIVYLTECDVGHFLPSRLRKSVPPRGNPLNSARGIDQRVVEGERKSAAGGTVDHHEEAANAGRLVDPDSFTRTT